MSFVKELDTPLLQLTKNDLFTFRNLCAAGVHVFGASGGGKTSGPGRMLAGGLLRSGAGGLVTAVKFEEIELWKRYAAEHGRGPSLIVFDENEGFNFLSYELARQGMDGIGSVTECLMRILEAARQVSGNSSNSTDAFWSDSARQTLRYAIPPLYSACGSLSVADIIRFIVTAPKNINEPGDANWQKRSFMYAVMDAAINRPRVPMSPAALENCIRYWAEEFCAIPKRPKAML